MEKYIYSKAYNIKWRIKFAHYYQFTECGKLINKRSGRMIKKTFSGNSIGFYVQGKFYTLKNLRPQLELIPKQETPF